MLKKRWLTPAELEEEFGINTKTQASWRSKKAIPYSKRGKFVFYDRREINKWLEDGKVSA